MNHPTPLQTNLFPKRKVLLFFILLTTQLFACMWDRDTLAEEAKGRPEIIKIIVGWFDRYPATYYQMRLDRVSKELETTPNDLALHDDAAVACDRIGRTEEAIAWMAKKKAVLDALPASDAKDHRYRYLSNLGTFHLHRWISLPQAQRETDLADLRESEKLVAQAIEENPDAHFGREIYQLLAIRWLLWDGVSPIESHDETIFTHGETEWVETYSSASDYGQIDGLSGLIQLGLGWESSDAFRSLAKVLDSGRLASISELAFQREKELLSTGKGSLHPLAIVRDQISSGQSRFLKRGRLERVRLERVRDYFPIAREAADRRNGEWIAYQQARFAKGMHPDTHPDFWKDWKEPTLPALPGSSPADKLSEFAKENIGINAKRFFAIIVLLSLIILKVVDSARRKASKAA